MNRLHILFYKIVDMLMEETLRCYQNKEEWLSIFLYKLDTTQTELEELGIHISFEEEKENLSSMYPDANSKEEAEEIVKEDIFEGRRPAPDNCYDSGCVIEEIVSDTFNATKLCELYTDSDLAALRYLKSYCNPEQSIELEHLIKLNLKWIEGEMVEVCGDEEDYHERKWKLFKQFGVQDAHGEMILAEKKERLLQSTV